MRKQYHVLNGDALEQMFPKEIQGEIIVMRECLVDGEVKAKNLDELFANRAQFIQNNYGDSEHLYYEKVVTEFEKIQRVNDDSDINLWFEDDLFCQVNFWFISYLLSQTITENNRVYLVRPQYFNQYGFGGLLKTELLSIYENRFEIKQLHKLACLWALYQENDQKNLLKTAAELNKTFPFILAAVEAHIARIPTEDYPGRPVQALLEIMKELGTNEFEPIFKQFNKKEYIYGFGDLQVKRLMDEIKIVRQT